MTFWAEYKVEVAVVLVALPGAARVLPPLLPRSSLSMIRTCPEAPFCPASLDGCSQRASCVSCGLPRSSLSMIRTCSEAPFVRPPLMDAASELRAYLVVKHAGEKRCLLCI